MEVVTIIVVVPVLTNYHCARVLVPVRPSRRGSRRHTSTSSSSSIRIGYTWQALNRVLRKDQLKAMFKDAKRKQPDFAFGCCVLCRSPTYIRTLQRSAGNVRHDFANQGRWNRWHLKPEPKPLPPRPRKNRLAREPLRRQSLPRLRKLGKLGSSRLAR